MEKPFKKSLREHRFIKELARTEEISVMGGKEEDLIELIDRISDEAEKLLEENEAWVKEKMVNVRDYLANYTDREIREAFLKSLSLSVVQRFRVYRDVSPAELDQFSDLYFRQELIRSCFTDFVLALRTYKYQQLSPLSALTLARKSYWHDPSTLFDLKWKYPNINEGVINHAALNYPTNPEKFIEEYSKRIVDLKQKYPDINESVVSTAALNYTANPEKFIEEYSKRIVDLKWKYPNINEGVISTAALSHPINPEKFINKYLEDITVLKQKYPDINEGVINHAALSYPTNPEKFIREYLKK